MANEMKFNLFKELYDQALEEKDLDYYIAERGWQEWMEGYEDQEIVDILTRIHSLANNPIKDTREASRADFVREFGIPDRTLQAWDYGNRTPPPYVKMLVDFAQFNN